jgi:hypothetical protein
LAALWPSFWESILKGQYLDCLKVASIQPQLGSSLAQLLGSNLKGQYLDCLKVASIQTQLGGPVAQLLGQFPETRSSLLLTEKVLSSTYRASAVRVLFQHLRK